MHALSNPLALLSLLVIQLLLAKYCTAQPANQSHVALTNEQPVYASLPAAATQYYVFTSEAIDYQQTALISLSASLGSPTLYVSLTNSTPSASSFEYSASWQTGGVVSITEQPPYTAYVAVVSSSTSRCNYSLLVTAYDTAATQAAPIPLTSAVPLASRIAAGEYRYYTYNVDAGTALTTVALTETYGQSWLLLNSPNNTAPPTLADYQYASSTATFPLVALIQPAAGVWTVGVWSAQPSAFSIIAANDVTTKPMDLGTLYRAPYRRANTATTRSTSTRWSWQPTAAASTSSYFHCRVMRICTARIRPCSPPKRTRAGPHRIQGVMTASPYLPANSQQAPSTVACTASMQAATCSPPRTARLL